MSARSLRLCLVPLTFWGCGTSAPSPSPDAAPETRAALAECGDLPRTEKQDCYQARLLARLEEADVRAALDMLSAIAAVDPEVEREAHVHTHAIGISSYDPERPVAEVFQACTELFQSGCYHGVIQAHFMAAGRVDESTVRGLCEAFKQPGKDRFLLFQCLHGLGHGLTMLHDYDLPTALEGCDLLEDSWDRESCYGGAFMENIVAATNPHHAATELVSEAHGHGEQAAMNAMAETEPAESARFEPLRRDDPHYPCSVLDDRYLTACYMMQTSAMLWLNGNDVGQAARDCQDAPDAWRRTCFQSLGRDVSAITLQDPERARGECGKAPEAWREWCYVGLVKNMVDLTATFDEGFDMCGRVEAAFRNRCYEAMGEEIGILRGTPDERRAECAAVPDPEGRKACLYGARLR